MISWNAHTYTHTLTQDGPFLPNPPSFFFPAVWTAAKHSSPFSMYYLPADVLREVVWFLAARQWRWCRLISRQWKQAVGMCLRSVRGLRVDFEHDFHRLAVLRLYFRACHNLQYLDVTCMGRVLEATPSALRAAVTSNGDTLCSLLQQAPKSLTSLDVPSWRGISSCLGGLMLSKLVISPNADEQYSVFEAVKQQTELTSLCLHCVTAGLPVPANLFTSLQKLQHIWIDDMSNKCLQVVTCSFQSLQSLRTGTSRVGGILLSKTVVAFLSKFTMLSALSFGRQYLRGSEWVDPLCRLQSLRFLGIDSNTLHAEACARIFGSFHQLWGLAITGESVDDAVIVSALRNNPNLTHLHVGWVSTALSGECFRHIAAHCCDRLCCLEVCGPAKEHPDYLALLAAHPDIMDTGVMYNDEVYEAFGFDVPEPFLHED